MSDSPLRLPSTVRPEHYDLHLAPDLATHTFTGSVGIDVVVAQAAGSVELHAVGLEIDSATIIVDGSPSPCGVEVEADDGIVRLTPERPVAPGETTIDCTFRGVIGEELVGFYRSTFTDVDGAKRTLAVTQFEAPYARRAFPCFDEPAHKATFGITLDIASDLLAVSNSPELSREPLGDGRDRVVFADTMKMSTYLVALVIGPLEATAPVDVDGTPLRIVHPPGKGHLTEFALDVGAFALRYFADYYGIIYPGAKLDMVAVPDFAFGAMENLGCVTYRETLLLVDPATATHAELQAVVDVIAHELAHMWFGDLVTMKWWNGIWLNEAFATFMEMRCTDAYRPGWDRWLHFGRERSRAFAIDALASTRAVEFPVHTPSDAEAMFDVLTYQKGSALVRMLEQYLGEAAFRDGIRRYLQTHQFGNTETTDLWDAIEAETGEPVRSMMDSWIFQAGFPQVHARSDGPGIVVDQQRFRTGQTPDEPDPVWEIPLVVRDATGRTERFILGEDSHSLPGLTPPVVVNAGGHGFYRVSYDPETLLDDVVATAPSREPLERYVLLDDCWALVRQGSLRADTVITLIESLVAAEEDALSVWQLMAAIVGELAVALYDDDLARLDRWIIATFGPALDRLGVEPAPHDSDMVRERRGLLLGLLGAAGRPATLSMARTLLARSVADPAAVDAGVAAGALRAVAAHADADDLAMLVDRFRNGATPQEQIRFLYALGAVRDHELFEQVLDLYLSEEVRTQNVAFALRAALGNRRNGSRAWRRIRDDWQHVIAITPTMSVSRLVESIGDFADPAEAADVDAFIAEHPIPTGARAVAQHLDRMHESVGLRRREADLLPHALDG